MKLSLEPPFDKTLAEDVAWRIEAMHDSFGEFLPDNFHKLPKFHFAKYQKPRADWDHDHCEGCAAKIMEHPKGPEVLAEGYADNENVLEANSWLCVDCHRILQDVVTGAIKVRIEK